MKICVIAPGHPTQNNAAQWAFVAARLRAYSELGHKVYCIIPLLKGQPILHSRYEIIQKSTEEDAMDIIRTLCPDVVACHAPDPNSFSGKVVTKIIKDFRTFLWIHGYESLYTAFYGYQRGWKIPLSLLRDAIRLKKIRYLLDNSVGVIYVSEWMKQAAQKGTGIPKCRSWVIPNPIDTNIFKPVKNRSESKQLRLITVRGLKRQYGIDLAIRALAGLKFTELTVVGNGPLKHEYETLAQKLLSPVIFLPATFTPASLAELYGEYDVFLAPSRTESQGVAMCEAMSCGLPVIATRIGGIPEFVTNGYSGILVKPGQPDQIREAIEKLAKDRDLVRRMGHNAANEIHDKCSIEIVINEELKLFENYGK